MTTETIEGEVVETALVEVPQVSGGALEAITTAEVQQQVATAKRYPRSIHKFKQEALALATADEETAGSMFYSLPRGGKAIEGPSVRLAEVCAYSWGNLRHGARVVEIEDKFVVAQGYCFDAEKNVGTAVEVRRRITDKYGKRYNDDMIGVTCNAACAIALRQAIFKVIPRVYANQIYAAARKVAIGDAQTLASRMAAMLDYFAKMGVSHEQVCQACEKPSIEDLSLDDLAMLKGLATALKDGYTTVDEAFGRAEPSTKRGRGAKPSKLNEPAETPTEGTT